MDKQQIISFIEEKIREGKISKDDIVAIGSMQAGQPNEITKMETSKNLIGILYGVGAIIAIIGVCILISQHWDEIGFAGRVGVTLGISLMTYFIALVLSKREQRVISQVLFTVSAVLAPLGSYVFLQEAQIDFNFTAQLGTSCALAAIFGVAWYITRRNILTLITIAFATWAYYATILKLFDFSINDSSFIIKWVTIVLGLSYISIAYGHQSSVQSSDARDAKEKKAIENILYNLGTLAVLIAGVTMDGVIELLYIGIIFLVFYGSVLLKNKSMLFSGALFLIIHIIRLTSQYFADSFGWSISLIFVGFFVIGVGYVTLYLNKKFISLKK